MDTDLEGQLRAYLQELVDYPDDEQHLPVYLDGRPLTKLYVEPDVQELHERDERSDHTLEDLDEDRGRPVAWQSVLSEELGRANDANEPWRTLVLAGPGYGKSLLLKMTAWRLAHEALGRWRNPGYPG